MEIINAESSSGPRSLFPPPSLSNDERRDSPLSISCNWQVSNNKQLIDAVTTASIKYAPERVSCETVVSLDTCVALQPVDSNAEPCVLTIEVLNCQKIARVAIVSEGNVLEIFKQFGEYEGTITAEFIDEFEKSVVYLGETTIHPPTTEVGIKVG
ncbi:PREDICTED: uncharacterized protein LOC105570814 [Vollenhovia emeryi]|uniref:uncharacterized protein LOC105570814 n=1 Tax=Vollenhovia emeryi TaxID=411798 RepID=UPI0005F52428|nr:PREDICTED: uncharacterized protein LOC105570814 [Vollenhovia emeryi]XP_011883654.1 PREDICTED: uncharacterized protein LOC105570814 [Vollenhovia emeryi]